MGCVQTTADVSELNISPGTRLREGVRSRNPTFGTLLRAVKGSHLRQNIYSRKSIGLTRGLVPRFRSSTGKRYTFFSGKNDANTPLDVTHTVH